MNYYSQFGEDRFVVEHGHELGLPEVGVFVEVGAGDGIELSNSKVFEDMGWKGLVIEPNPVFTLPLTNNRKCFKEFVQVTTDLNHTSFFCHQTPTWSGRLRANGTEINVHTRRLDSLLFQYKLHTKIDVLSIDTEGTEIDVLNSMGTDGETYLDNVNVLIVEYDTAEIINTKNELLDYLLPKFNLLHTTECNLILKHK